jgi:hypothetical protein
VRITRTSLLAAFAVAFGALYLTAVSPAQDKPGHKPATGHTTTPSHTATEHTTAPTKSGDEDTGTPDTDKPTKEQEVPLEEKLKVFTEESFIAKHIATSQEQAFEVTKHRHWPSKSTSTHNTVIELNSGTLTTLTKAHTHGTTNQCAIVLPAWECRKGGADKNSCTFHATTTIGIQYHSPGSAHNDGGTVGKLYHIATPPTKACELK